MLSEKDIVKSCDVLGLNPAYVVPEINEQHFNEEKLFQSFLDLYNRTKKIHREELVASKITLLVHLEEHLFSVGRPLRIPIRNFCPACRAKGFIPEREKIISKATCKKCDGSGIKTVPCKKCEGSGKVSGETCPTCRGTGKYRLYKTGQREQVNCPTCSGSGEVPSVQDGPKIVNLEMCKKCGGIGFDPKYPVGSIVSHNIGSLIRQKLQTKRHFNDPVDLEWEVRRSMGWSGKPAR